jgi:signal transduction histidine kinase
MRKLNSTQVLCGGFLVILVLLSYAAVKADRLESSGTERQTAAYRVFIEMDDAISALRRTVWLGGIYSRDYFLEPDASGRAELLAQIEELRGIAYPAVVRLAPARTGKGAAELRAEFDGFFNELSMVANTAASPRVIERVLIPRRLALLTTLEDMRRDIRQELADSQAGAAEARRVAARDLRSLTAAAIVCALLIGFFTVRYAARLEGERHRHYSEISQANRELEALSARVLEVQEQERRALSQELHDEVGQTLTALRMELSLALTHAADPVLRAQLGHARQLVESTTHMVRDISLMLRPSLLDDLGLGPALQWQLDQFARRSGVRVRFTGADVGESLPDAVKTCVYRIAQEALNNCEKYSRAAAVHVVLQQHEGLVTLEIRDDGDGFALDHRGLPSSGSGILGMKERAHALGGTLTIDTSPGRGARIALSLPIDAVPEPLATRSLT